MLLLDLFFSSMAHIRHLSCIVATQLNNGRTNQPALFHDITHRVCQMSTDDGRDCAALPVVCQPTLSVEI